MTIVPAIVLYLLYGMLVLTPLWQVAVEVTLSVRQTAGSQISLWPVSYVCCSSPSSIVASPLAVQVLIIVDLMNNDSLKNIFLVSIFVLICRS